jgi:hypothetical protein
VGRLFNIARSNPFHRSCHVQFQGPPGPQNLQLDRLQGHHDVSWKFPNNLDPQNLQPDRLQGHHDVSGKFLNDRDSRDHK